MPSPVLQTARPAVPSAGSLLGSLPIAWSLTIAAAIFFASAFSASASVMLCEEPSTPSLLAIATSQVQEPTPTADNLAELPGSKPEVGGGQQFAEPPLVGDFNYDGMVDGVDYAIWREGLAKGTMTSPEFDGWQGMYGSTQAVPPPTPNLVSPEPTSAFVFVGLAVTVASAARRRR